MDMSSAPLSKDVGDVEMASIPVETDTNLREDEVNEFVHLLDSKMDDFTKKENDVQADGAVKSKNTQKWSTMNIRMKELD